MKWKALLLTLLLLLPLFCGCTQPEQGQVAATTLPVYQFTSRLCEGTGISVTRLVTESVSCLHDYSLNVSQVRAVESAEVVIISGGGLEEFMHDVLHDASTVIDSSAGIALLGCSEAHDHGDEHGHSHDADPHFWLSPIHTKTMAENICAGLTEKYPAHKELFQKNLSSLLHELDELQAYGEAQLASLCCRELITFHDGFGYLAANFDLTILEAIEEESGSEASAQELIRLIKLVEAHKLPAVFTEVSGSSSAAGIISAETGAGLYSLDMAMAGDDYFEAMYHNIDTIKEALG